MVRKFAEKILVDLKVNDPKTLKWAVLITNRPSDSSKTKANLYGRLKHMFTVEINVFIDW